jgi:RNA polymerase sigma-70 factor (ECF subfamily)
MRSDTELVDAIRGGDLEAFDELMRRYERLVYRVAVSFVSTPENAFDVTQTVFLKAYRGLSGFRSEANLKTWLLRITHNESVNWLRSVSGREAGHEQVDELAEVLPGRDSQESDLLARERRAELERAMGKLNERYRLAVVLRYFQGLDIAEISAVLGCSEGVTKNILFRSVRMLRESLSQVA